MQPHGPTPRLPAPVPCTGSPARTPTTLLWPTLPTNSCHSGRSPAESLHGHRALGPRKQGLSARLSDPRAGPECPMASLPQQTEPQMSPDRAHARLAEQGHGLPYAGPGILPIWDSSVRDTWTRAHAAKQQIRAPWQKHSLPFYAFSVHSSTPSSNRQQGFKCSRVQECACASSEEKLVRGTSSISPAR